MPEEEKDEQKGTWTTTGEDAPEWKETLSPDDGGDDPHEPPSEPEQPSPPRP